MATKFLSFITEKSSEVAIFKAILKRTKGSSKGSIATLFSVVLDQGIEKVQKKIDGYSSNLTTSAKVNKLVEENADYAIRQDIFSFWGIVLRMESVTHEVFDSSELEIFFTVLLQVLPERLKESGIEFNYEYYKQFREPSADISLDQFDNIAFKQKDSTRVGFISLEELKVFTLYTENTSKEPVSICPVFIDTKDYDGIYKAVYKENCCISPYSSEE